MPKKANKDDIAKKACGKWLGVRSFVQVFAFGGEATARKSSDTMGMKHRVDHGVHIAFDAKSPQFAKRTGFSDDDAEKIKTVLTKLFEGDALFACPEGNVEVMKLIWLEHSCKAG